MTSIIIPSDIPAVLNGGWAWMYVLASFCLNGIIDGICNSAALLLPSYSEYFGVSIFAASWPISLMIATYLLAGMFVAGLLRKFGAFTITIVGGCIASSGIFLSSYSPNIVSFILCSGIIGLGFGFVYLPSIVIVTESFDSKRALATGIVVSGTGFGSIIFTALIPQLVSIGYDWKQIHLMVFLPVSLIPLVLAILYRKPKKTHDTPEAEKLMNGVEAAVESIQKEQEENRLYESPVQPRKRLFTHSGFSSLLVNDSERMVVSTGHLNTVGVGESNHHLSVTPSGSLKRMDMLYSGSLTNLKEFKKNGNIEDFRRSMIIPDEEDASTQSVAPISTKRKLLKKICRFFTKTLSLRLLMDKRMILIFISNLLAMLAFYIPPTFVKQLGMSRDLEEKTLNLLVPTMNVANTIARILVGILADRRIVSPLTINNIGLIFGGILTVYASFATTTYEFYAYMIIFGLVMAPYISLTSIYIADIVGIAELSGGMGLITLSRGIACLLGTPLAGFTQEMTGSYPITFAVSGAAFILAGAISFLVNCVHAEESIKVEDGTNDVELEEVRKLSLPTIPENSEDSFEDLAEFQKSLKSAMEQPVESKE